MPYMEYVLLGLVAIIAVLLVVLVVFTHQLVNKPPVEVNMPESPAAVETVLLDLITEQNELRASGGSPHRIHALQQRISALSRGG